MRRTVRFFTSYPSFLAVGGLLAAATMATTAVAGVPAPLLQTGQRACYSDTGVGVPCAGSGQDGEVRAGVASRLVDNGDGTITDRTTGLMWEKLSDDGSIHDRDAVWSWTLWPSKIGELNRQGFAGHRDWRMPNARELESIQHYGHERNAVESIFRQGCAAGCSVLECSCSQRDSLWSSTTASFHGAGVGYLVEFRLGRHGAALKRAGFPVRAVRRDPSVAGPLRTPRTSQERCWHEGESGWVAGTCEGTGQDGEIQAGARRSFVDNGDGTITDRTTGLMWEKLSLDGSIHDQSRVFSWSEAFDKAGAANSERFGGYDDWRVPNVRELASLRSFRRRGSMVYPVFDRNCRFGCTPFDCSCRGSIHWSSTSFGRRPAEAWAVYNAAATEPLPKTLRLGVRLVRTAEAP